MLEEKFDFTNSNGIIKSIFNRKREYKRTGYKFISDEWFERLTIGIRKQGGLIIRGGKKVEEYLDSRGAAAETIGDVLIFRQDVTISEVIEEIRHFEQNMIGLNHEEPAEKMICLNEIDAKEYVLAVSKRYKIPRKEIRETKKQLADYRMELKRLEEKDNVQGHK